MALALWTIVNDYREVQCSWIVLLPTKHFVQSNSIGPLCSLLESMVGVCSKLVCECYKTIQIRMPHLPVKVLSSRGKPRDQTKSRKMARVD
jgi:hypothetical protein